MQNDNVKRAVLGFQGKLDSFKAKIRYQHLLAQSLAVEFDSLTSEFESLKRLFGASSEQIESTKEQFDASSYKTESTSFNFESTKEKNGVTSYKTESTSYQIESTSEQIDASSSPQELASLIWRLAEEKKIYFGQPNIPNRLAQILLALGERKKLSVLEMRRITGASRNTLVRDIKIFKELGWLEFHGSRKNGYFTLTDLVPDVILREGSG
jgi:DNA-binding transcriptional ArsR family regulator